MPIRPEDRSNVKKRKEVKGKSEEKDEKTEKKGKCENIYDLEDALGQEMATEEGEAAQKKEEDKKEEAKEDEAEGRESDEGEEGRVAQRIVVPQKVTQREREEHNLTHTPYRAWCQYCVKGRGKNLAHRSGQDDEDQEKLKVPRCTMDYVFMSKEDEKASKNLIIVTIDEYIREVCQSCGQKRHRPGE